MQGLSIRKGVARGPARCPGIARERKKMLVKAVGAMSFAKVALSQKG